MAEIHIGHLYRVEGHGGIKVTVGPEGIETCEMRIFEGARFYEALLRGRGFQEIPSIVCRVCGICSAGHALCSLAAIENSLGMEIHPEVARFRHLLNLGQWIESHALHLFCLAVPDFVGYPGILSMVEDYGEEIKKGLFIKRAGNSIQEVVGGRAVHPVNMVVGGMGRRPKAKEMARVVEELGLALDHILSLEPFIASLPEPGFRLPSAVFAALRPEGGRYGTTGPMLAARGHEEIPAAEFRSRVNERVVAHSTAKQALFAKEPFMVGSAARLFHNGTLLAGEAAGVRDRLLPGEITSLSNNLAQFVELVWALEEALELADSLASSSESLPDPVAPNPVEERYGQAALEVPRGTLYHGYTIGADGSVLDADIITPTAQNLAHIERDFAAAAHSWLREGGDEEVLRQRLEVIVRAYDPCISCSTHLIDMRFR